MVKGDNQWEKAVCDKSHIVSNVKANLFSQAIPSTTTASSPLVMFIYTVVRTFNQVIQLITTNTAAVPSIATQVIRL